MKTTSYWDHETVTVVSKDEGGRGLAMAKTRTGTLKIDEIGQLGRIGTVTVDTPEELDALIDALEEHRNQLDDSAAGSEGPR